MTVSTTSIGVTPPTTDFNSYGVDRNTLRKEGARPKTAALFVETNQAELTDPAPYSLTGNYSDRVSIRDVYMDIADPTEYRFVEEFLGSWPQWETLLKCEWFTEHLESMRRELRAKLQSEAIEKYKSIAMSGDSVATRWFAEGNFSKSSEPNLPKKRGPKPKSGGALDTDVSTYADRMGIRK